MQLPCRYAGGNYQGKDMCHMQKVLSSRFAQAAGGDGLKAHVARMALAVLPRGGGEGDAIRMTILDLLRNNGIKEGHRPGIECPFLAQVRLAPPSCTCWFKFSGSCAQASRGYGSTGGACCVSTRAP